jgi:hypothetical protein
MSVISPVSPLARPAGTVPGVSGLGYWIEGDLVAAACIDAAAWVVAGRTLMGGERLWRARRWM